jgi:Flp pilus assembly pilin Flp
MTRPPTRLHDIAKDGLALMRRFVRDDSAQDLIEYAYLAAFIGTAGWFALSSIGPTVAVTYATWIDPNTGSPSLWDPCYLTSTNTCTAGS